MSEDEAGADGGTPEQGEPADAPRERRQFVFTDDGCRTEIRIGALLILMAVFLWLWLGPAACTALYFLGLPLLLVGVPLQALEARRRGRPGFPWKLGLVLALGGALMWPDLRYRVLVDGPAEVQPLAPMLVVAGVWILAWWPVVLRAPRTAAGAAS